MAKLKDKPKLLPIRRGLFDKKHYNKMADAVWLFGFLISIVSWKSWEGETKYKTIRGRFGVSNMTVYRWLRKLRDEGYINYERGQYNFKFKINRPPSQEVFKEINEFFEKFGKTDLT